jgi:hypothetical protein
MSDIIYDESKNNPLNRKIAEVFAANTFEECKKLCRECYEFGVKDGQEFVWKMRAGDYEEIPNPDLPDDVKNFIAEQKKKEKIKRAELEKTISVTTTTNANNEIDYFEMVSGKLTHKHGVPDDKWGTR